MFKKIAGILFLFTCMILTFSTSVFANPETDTNDVYKKAIELSLIQLGKDGTVQLSMNKEKTRKINGEFYNELSEVIDSINYLVENNFGSVNENFEIELLSPDEITEITFQERNSQSHFEVNPYSVNPGYPSLALNSLVTGNRNELEKFYNSVLKVSPQSAYSSAVGYFVGKVKENGPWDYKVQAGFRPWSKKFYATMFGGTQKVVTSEYIGNYNYGFTGEFLFSKNILLIGGQAVGGNVFKPESAEDRAPIILGYDHAVRYR